MGHVHQFSKVRVTFTHNSYMAYGSLQKNCNQKRRTLDIKFKRTKSSLAQHICQLSRIERETNTLLYHLTHLEWVSFLTQIHLWSIITRWCRHFVDRFFFIYSGLINAICTCWTTYAYNCCDDNYVSTKEGVIFGERLIYLRSHNTRCFWSSYGLIISSVFSDNEEKVTIWIAPLICL